MWGGPKKKTSHPSDAGRFPLYRGPCGLYKGHINILEVLALALAGRGKFCDLGPIILILQGDFDDFIKANVNQIGLNFLGPTGPEIVFNNGGRP